MMFNKSLFGTQCVQGLKRALRTACHNYTITSDNYLVELIIMTSSVIRREHFLLN